MVMSTFRVEWYCKTRDISSDNVVPPDRIANADIDYIGAGDTAVSVKKDGILIS